MTDRKTKPTQDLSRPAAQALKAMPDQVRGSYLLTTDSSRFDLQAIHSYLTRSYWSPGIPFDAVAAGVTNSLGFALLHRSEQVGFARLITDYASFAHLADVFVLEEHQGCGLGQWLVSCALAHPSLRGLRRWTLNTADAHSLYAKFGFTPIGQPERMMERLDPMAYRRSAAADGDPSS